jgi:hypothetical protein
VTTGQPTVCDGPHKLLLAFALHTIMDRGLHQHTRLWAYHTSHTSHLTHVTRHATLTGHF